MTMDLLTVVTTTVGDSHRHLVRQMEDLRKFTKLPFKQIVCDDGTIDDEYKRKQQRVVSSFGGANWMEHTEPFGISFNINAALEAVKTPWAFLLEDGLRAGSGWLETAVDAIEKIGHKKWLGYEVGAIGCDLIVDWQLAMGGAFADGRNPMDYTKCPDHETYYSFWSVGHYPEWNDGYWCWNRLMPAVVLGCFSPMADGWGHPGPGDIRDLVRSCNSSYKQFMTDRDVAVREPYSPVWDRNINAPGGWKSQAWPRNRHPLVCWGGSPFVLINMDIWRKVGRMRDGCSFFEGHLGVRMAQHGYLWVWTEFPPWLHYGGMGFFECTENKKGKEPRIHLPNEGPGDVLLEDFGCNGSNHVELFGPGGLVEKHFPKEMQQRLNEKLESVELYMEPGWRKWQ